MRGLLSDLHPVSVCMGTRSGLDSEEMAAGLLDAPAL